MDKLREKLRKIMYGRYGMDALSQVMVYISLALWVVTIIFRSSITDVMALVFLFGAYFRIFSKNIPKRYAELQKFEMWKQKIKRTPQTVAARKMYHIYKCPQCKQKVRVPRGKGRIEISCPRCRTKFIKKS
ncbi:MAG: hypothetical protein ACI4F9_04190 [Lachnospiraceae bacterium]